MLGHTIQPLSCDENGTSCQPTAATVLPHRDFWSGTRGIFWSSPRFIVKIIKINAPPEAVWKQVVAFSEIPPPTELLFRAGIAYPVRAEITGHGPGAVRHCVFSTGPFVEPIEIWDRARAY